MWADLDFCVKTAAKLKLLIFESCVTSINISLAEKFI